MFSLSCSPRTALIIIFIAANETLHKHFSPLPTAKTRMNHPFDLVRTDLGPRTAWFWWIGQHSALFDLSVSLEESLPTYLSRETTALSLCEASVSFGCVRRSEELLSQLG